MIRTILKGNRSGYCGGLLAMVLVAVGVLPLGGCAGGVIGALPAVTRPSEAATVTVFRDSAWEGFIGPVTLWIDDLLTFRIWRMQEYTFMLDPGEYIFFWAIGFNQCRKVAFLRPRQTYRFRLAANCVRFDGPFWEQMPGARRMMAPSNASGSDSTFGAFGE